MTAVVAVLGACAPGDGGAGAPPPTSATTTSRDRPDTGCPFAAGEVGEVVGFAVERDGPLVAGRCMFIASDIDAHPGTSVDVLVVPGPDALATVRDEVVARTGITAVPRDVEGATDAYDLRLGVVAQVGAVDPVGGVVVTVADPARTPGQAAAAAAELAALALR